jgi:hypothetical protein
MILKVALTNNINTKEALILGPGAVRSTILKHFSWQDLNVTKIRGEAMSQMVCGNGKWQKFEPEYSNQPQICDVLEML